MTEVEQALYQTKNRSRQDPLNFPIKLTNKLAHLNSLNGSGDYRPTAQSYQVKDELSQQIDNELKKFRKVVNEDIPELNRMIRERAVDPIMMKEKPPVN